MSKIGKKIPCRSCLTEAILVIRKKVVRFEMFGSELSKVSKTLATGVRDRAIVGGVGAVTLLRPEQVHASHEIRIQRTGASSSANSFRNLGGMPSPEALSVFAFTSRDDDGGYRVREGLSRRIRTLESLREELAKSKNQRDGLRSRIEQAIEPSGRISEGKLELQKLSEEIRTRNIFQ